MYHTRNINVVLTSCCALFLFFTLTTICAAQTTGKIVDVNDERFQERIDHLMERIPSWANETDALRQKYREALVDYSFRSVQQGHAARPLEGPGWLIIDCERIHSPFDVVVHDSCITANGLRVYPEAPAEIDTNVVVESAVLERVQVSDSLWKALPIWLEEGLETAEHLAVEFMQSQPIVDTAYIAEPGTMRVVYHGRLREVDFALASGRNSRKPSEGWLREQLEKKAARIRSALTHHGLVIAQDGHLRIERSFEAPLIFARLQEIARDISEQEARYQAIIKVFDDETVAHALAERFMQ